MQIYLPIAEVSVNAFVLLGLGGLVGILSGMFGVGGGFLMTPLLFFIGIPPAVAVATEANQIVASSFSGVLAHFRRRTVDFKMGLVLLIGGLIGAALGVVVFNYLKSLGQVDLLVRLCYVVFLGVVGGLMFIESLNALRKSRKSDGAPPAPRRHRGWIHALPFKMRFRTSGLYISVIPPLLVGVVVGILSAIMGVGGGFIMVPAMIYLLGMPTKVVVGTSLFQIIFVTAFTTLLHATTNYTVDIVLAVLLLVGGVIGAQIGTQIGLRLKAEQLRILLAGLVLVVCGKLALDLLLEPAELYSLGAPGGIEMRRWLLVLLFGTVLSGWAAAEEVVLGLSQDEVAITTQFDGSEILIFGAVKREKPIPEGPPLEVVIAVAGPSEPVIVRRKANRFGIWVNTDAVEVDRAPSFYAVATSGPFDEVVSDTEDLRHRISIPRAIRSVGAPYSIEDAQTFAEAVIRIRKEQELYQILENHVAVDQQTLFRTSIKLPANLTEGDYSTRIFLTRDGKIVSAYETVIDVRKVGLERWLYALSRQQPLIYGLMSLAIAIAAGWGASTAFRLLRER